MIMPIVHGTSFLVAWRDLIRQASTIVRRRASTPMSDQRPDEHATVDHVGRLLSCLRTAMSRGSFGDPEAERGLP
jgi:hypothetical protein